MGKAASVLLYSLANVRAAELGGFAAVLSTLRDAGRICSETAGWMTHESANYGITGKGRYVAGKGYLRQPDGSG